MYYKYLLIAKVEGFPYDEYHIGVFDTHEDAKVFEDKNHNDTKQDIMEELELERDICLYYNIKTVPYFKKGEAV